MPTSPKMFSNSPDITDNSLDNSESKLYYTPDISEFHIGFKFEKLTSNNTWEEVIFDTGFKWSSFRSDLDQGYIRVKRLTISAITNLGLELLKTDTPQEINSQTFKDPINHIKLYRPFAEEDLFIVSVIDDFFITTPSEEDDTQDIYTIPENSLGNSLENSKDVFVGLIRNSSELNKILKCLVY